MIDAGSGTVEVGQTRFDSRHTFVDPCKSWNAISSMDDGLDPAIFLVNRIDSPDVR